MRKSLKGISIGMIVFGILFLTASFALASEGASADTTAYTKAIVVGCALLGAGLGVGLGAIGSGMGIGNAASGGSSAVGRNPDAQGKIMLTMLVGMAMAESCVIYALVIGLVILYANPLLKIVVG
ncbi:MAG TPA: ATP synthase F0 subunit C [Syntrophales bacterium]|nr:ATP synthase F0 subunit C [Syntrophales bacterium]HPX11465.1 ATP synthase F0 subunit C [Syntrophales bacterium]HQB31090.1 ATP synthase F0 subunit C [Syntrophales bacterium]HQN77922.1 ATP synthase F0 subunit C [Syntrophales bacterium]HQQ28254.1 ATP synthase F0 subunit C [Syntrophales bacterium]